MSNAIKDAVLITIGAVACFAFLAYLDIKDWKVK